MRHDPSLDPGFVTGRVVDDAGTGLVGVAVSTSQRHEVEGRETRATSGEDGRFRLGPLAADANATLFFDLPSRGRERAEGVVVFSGIDHDLGDVLLPEGFVATGTVVDETGRPIEGATVSLQSYFHEFEHTIERFGASVSLSTASNGGFSTPRLPASLVLVRADRPGRVAFFMAIESPRPASVDDLGAITLAPEVVLHGRVVTKEGVAVAGARLWAINDQEHATSTASDGSFELHGQGHAPSQLEVRRDGFAHRHRVRIEAPEETAIVLDRAFEVSGTVVDDESGAPVKVLGIGLFIVTRERPGSSICVENGQEIDDWSRFRLWYETAADYELAAGADGYESGRLALGCLEPPEERHGVVLRLRRSANVDARAERAAIAGLVMGLSPGTAAIASAWYRLPEFGPGNLRVRRGVTLPFRSIASGLATIAPDGSFRLDDVGGSVMVRIDRPGAAPIVAGPFTIHRGEEKRVEIQCSLPATLTGRLTGVPGDLAGALWVVLSDERAIPSCARVGRDGRFTIEVSTGRYALRAGSDAYSTFSPPPTPHATAEERARDVQARTRPLLEVDLAPGERRDLGDVAFRGR